ncbi:MAG TPA: ABC transporter permease [Phycisphaerae bacterium]|jgi:ABC-type dipeptide/oligopeptide/nickel transport system permease subunit
MTQNSNSQSRPSSRAWRRFRAHRAATASGVFLLIALVLVIMLAPFSASWYDVQGITEAIRHPPAAHSVVDYEAYRQDLQTRPVGRSFLSIGRSAYRATAWMGYDNLGRSLLYRCLFGWLVSLTIGLAAAAISVTIGVMWGSTAALAGGRTDALLMRVVDILYGLPYILLVILLKIALTHPLTRLCGDRVQAANVIILFIAIGAVSWLTMARVIRGQVLSLREQPFIEAARAAGVGPLGILRRHLLPNLIGPIVVYATLVIPQAILQESFLSFLGIGVQAPTPSLGRLAAEGIEAVNPFVGFWWLIAFPCGLLVLTLLALNFLGDGLRDAFDPKSSTAVLV